MPSPKTKALLKKLKGDETKLKEVSHANWRGDKKPVDQKAFKRRFMDRGRGLPDIPDVFSDMTSGRSRKRDDYEPEQ